MCSITHRQGKDWKGFYILTIYIAYFPHSWSMIAKKMPIVAFSTCQFNGLPTRNSQDRTKSRLAYYGPASVSDYPGLPTIFHDSRAGLGLQKNPPSINVHLVRGFQTDCSIYFIKDRKGALPRCIPSPPYWLTTIWVDSTAIIFIKDTHLMKIELQ